MRALTRIRTLAAMCALLSFLTASVLAGVPGRPIDRPEGPPDPTTEVGDPDMGNQLTWDNFRQLFIAAFLGNPTLRHFAAPFHLKSATRSVSVGAGSRRR